MSNKTFHYPKIGKSLIVLVFLDVNPSALNLCHKPQDSFILTTEYNKDTEKFYICITKFRVTSP